VLLVVVSDLRSTNTRVTFISTGIIPDLPGGEPVEDQALDVFIIISFSSSMSKNVCFALLAELCVLPCFIFSLICKSFLRNGLEWFFILDAELSRTLQF